ncbi:hypothetical protein [Cellulomonas sp. NS3]|uniref:hypothetical protein n=1 Tax=Cellulomonas sp. NS3 TaxID=2973977 RepID=UPI002161C178|nr:hypothetical protein [Cellulomonas sp. NS3]
MTVDVTGASVDLVWLPLGAGGHLVRHSGRLYERLTAWSERRTPCDLYHSALQVTLDGHVWAVEMTPVRRAHLDRGVVAEGAVGTRRATPWRLFRYEVRCWRDGAIPDLAYAVSSPVRLASGPAVCRRVLRVLPSVPTPVWGRDELGLGEMWNSNSVISWCLEKAAVADASFVRPPFRGGAPGWGAGIRAARINHVSRTSSTSAHAGARRP